MRNNKNGLDEMQRELRNKIGNQMFMILAYALMLNCGLYSFGIRWLNYPADVWVILTACLGIYLVRLIAGNAYLPAKAQARKPVVTLVVAIVFSIVLAFAMIKLFGQSPAQIAEPTEDNSAIILVIVSVVGLLAALIAAVIKRVNNRDDKDE
jgi:hypothetical protein